MYILSAKNLMPSAKLLAEKLEEFAGSEPIRAFPIPIKDDVMGVRWGNSQQVSKGETKYNSPDHVRSVGNKWIFALNMQDAKIAHTELHRETPKKFPVVVRTQLTRGGGIGIVVCENSEQFAPYKEYPWSYWYNFSTEVGVHMLGGEVRRLFKKIRVDGLEEEKYPRRNTNNGYRFSLVSNDKYPKLLEFCKEFYRALPIQMGRADVGWDSDAKCWRIIEFNSAPDLTQNQSTLEMYAKFLAERI